MISRIFIAVSLSVLLPVVHQTPAIAQTAVPPRGIWFNASPTTLNRFTYSQAILWPSTIGSHIYLYIREDVTNWSRIVTLDNYRRTFTMPPVWDRDSLSWNYGVHPIMGSFSYLTYRNKGAHWTGSFAGAAINSAIYEYIIAGGTQRPSINDLIITPVLGSLLGEGIYQVKKRLLRDHHLNFMEKVLLTITDPFEALYYGFNYRKICQVSYR